MNDETIAIIKKEIHAASHFIERYTPIFERLNEQKKNSKLSQWGYYELGTVNAEINAKSDFVDILNDILRSEGI